MCFDLSRIAGIFPAGVSAPVRRVGSRVQLAALLLVLQNGVVFVVPYVSDVIHSVPLVIHIAERLHLKLPLIAFSFGALCYFDCRRTSRLSLSAFVQQVLTNRRKPIYECAIAGGGFVVGDAADLLTGGSGNLVLFPSTHHHHRSHWYVHVRVPTRAYACMQCSLHAHTSVHTHVCSAQLHVCMHACMHTWQYMHTCMLACASTCVHTCVHGSL